MPKYNVCPYCGDPVEKWLGRIVMVDGIDHHLHNDCWKAILVTEKLNPTVSKGYSEFPSISHEFIVSEFFRRKRKQKSITFKAL